MLDPGIFISVVLPLIILAILTLSIWRAKKPSRKKKSKKPESGYFKISSEDRDTDTGTRRFELKPNPSTMQLDIIERHKDSATKHVPKMPTVNKELSDYLASGEHEKRPLDTSKAKSLLDELSELLSDEDIPSHSVAKKWGIILTEEPKRHVIRRASELSVDLGSVHRISVPPSSPDDLKPIKREDGKIVFPGRRTKALNEKKKNKPPTDWGIYL